MTRGPVNSIEEESALPPAGRHPIHESAQQLQAQVERHRVLLETLLSGGGPELEACPYVECPHERRLRRTLAETIDVLEQTRSAFKSRQLETLRKKLMRVLAERT